MYDVIVIGGGPAGIAGAIYSARNKLHTLLLSKEVPLFQSAVSNGGFFGMYEINQEFQTELKLNTGLLELAKNEEVVSLEKNIVSFSVEAKSGRIYYSRAVIITSGQNQDSGAGNTEFDLLTHKDINGKIKVDERMRTNITGIFAAGGVTTTLSYDIFISAAEGAKAAISAFEFFKQK